jgi:hypothetical protein
MYRLKRPVKEMKEAVEESLAVFHLIGLYKFQDKYRVD